MDPIILHDRYTIQAGWTRALREYLFQKFRLSDSPRILDVGCGSGVVTSHMPGAVFGLDLSLSILHTAVKVSPGPHYAAGDGYHLPYQNDTFDLVCCHFFLMWLNRPLSGLEEMVRVLKPGGFLAAFAEPDYGGRVDYPYELVDPGKLQIRSLKESGCDPETGRKLRYFLSNVQLSEIHCGVQGGEWTTPGETDPQLDSEWATLRSDLEPYLSPEKIAHVEKLDKEAWSSQSRILYVPTFYAWARKPDLPGS